jgi:hypothetical protein
LIARPVGSREVGQLSRPLRSLQNGCAARKSAALPAQANFNQRNRCAGCAGKNQAENPLRWMRNEI